MTTHRKLALIGGILGILINSIIAGMAPTLGYTGGSALAGVFLGKKP